MKLPDLNAVRTVLGHVRSYLPAARRDEPIVAVGDLVEFVNSRSAFIAQTSLYGYLKTRMGTRYPEMFQDDAFVVSINRAKWDVCAACLSDLTVFAAGHCVLSGALAREEAGSFAAAIFDHAIESAFCDSDARPAKNVAVPAFAARLAETDWQTVGDGANAFTRSPGQLVRSAPVTDAFKADDREIIVNSIRFRWREVREHLRKHADVDAICTDWRAINSA